MGRLEHKIILDLCGGTGAWSKPYKDAGYDVHIVTLPEHNVIDYIPPKNNVFGILAAPPCDQFSLAKNRWLNDPVRGGERDFIKGMNTVNACIRIIFQTKPRFWALENPVGMLSRWLGKPGYTFHPWWFGDPWTKRTALWGTFNVPKRKYYNFVDLPQKTPIINGKKYSSKKDKIPSISAFTCSSEIRAITPGGFASAFFDANNSESF